jgi:hypothetical protein
MKKRCNYETGSRYKDWGGRGITYYEKWDYDFWDYVAHIDSLPDASVAAEKGLTIDRINNDEGYFPGNLRWATKSTQSFNRRKWGKGYRYYPEQKGSKKWRVRLQINGQKKHYGWFATEEEAAAKVKEVRDGLA